MSKIRLSIERASDEAQAPMTASDIEVLGEMIESIIMENGVEPIHVDDIQNITIFCLMKMGFRLVARFYNTHRR